MEHTESVNKANVYCLFIWIVCVCERERKSGGFNTYLTQQNYHACIRNVTHFHQICKNVYFEYTVNQEIFIVKIFSYLMPEMKI